MTRPASDNKWKMHSQTSLDIAHSNCIYVKTIWQFWLNSLWNSLSQHLWGQGVDAGWGLHFFFFFCKITQSLPAVICQVCKGDTVSLFLCTNECNTMNAFGQRQLPLYTMAGFLHCFGVWPFRTSDGTLCGLAHLKNSPAFSHITLVRSGQPSTRSHRQPEHKEPCTSFLQPI